MREIKFRGKRIDNGEWVYGYLVKSEDYIFDYSERIDIPYIIPFNNFNLKDYVEYRVEEKTIGQFTGIYDKNNTPIYEGDIIQYKPEKVKYIVMFDPTGYWCLDGDGFRNSEMLIQTDDTNKYIEVIGNIFDNKEEI